MKPVNSVLSRYGTTIFTAMSALALEHGAVNLGQGFPDEEGPEALRRAAAEAVLAGPNQYPPMRGMPELRQAVADHNRRFYGLDVDWQTEVLVTSDATEALADCFLGLIEPGDEAVLFEPLYDSYLPGPPQSEAGRTGKTVGPSKQRSCCWKCCGRRNKPSDQMTLPWAAGSSSSLRNPPLMLRSVSS